MHSLWANKALVPMRCDKRCVTCVADSYKERGRVLLLVNLMLLSVKECHVSSQLARAHAWADSQGLSMLRCCTWLLVSCVDRSGWQMHATNWPSEIPEANRPPASCNRTSACCRRCHCYANAAHGVSLNKLGGQARKLPQPAMHAGGPAGTQR